MRRLRLLDVALLVALVPLWIVCWVLSVQMATSGRLAWVPLSVKGAESAESYPTVREFFPGAKEEHPDLLIGDRLIHLGDSDLRGVGSLGFVARVYEETNPGLLVPVTFVRLEKSGETSLHLTPVTSPWVFLLLTLGFVLAGILTILCEPGSRPARAFFLASLAFSFHWTLFFGGSRLQTYAWTVVHVLSAFVMLPLTLRTAMVFPEKLMLARSSSSTWPWLFAIFGPIASSAAFGVPFLLTLGLHGIYVTNIIFLAVLLVILTRNFLHANPVERRQLKWVVYGLYVGTAPVLAADAVVALNPSLLWLHELSMAAPTLIPICICIAILRLNFFDIDRLMSSTIAYSLLFILLTGVIMFVVPELAQAASAVVSATPISWHAVFSIAFAMLILPGQRRLRPQIERFFFPVRYAIEQGILRLLSEISSRVEARQLLTVVPEQLGEILQPENFALYGQTETAFTPVLVEGSIVPAPIELHRPMIAALRMQQTPLDVDRWRRGASASLEPDDLEILENLRVNLILPIQRDERVVAFLCLGRKRSGDVYTPIDIALLTTVTKKLGDALLRCTDENVRDDMVMLAQRSDQSSGAPLG